MNYNYAKFVDRNSYLLESILRFASSVLHKINIAKRQTGHMPKLITLPEVILLKLADKYYWWSEYLLSKIIIIITIK